MIVVVPMAGRGSRFSDKGFTTPKPLIEVAGKPMLLWSVKSIEHVTFSKIIFIALKEHEEKFHLHELLKKNLPYHFELILIEEVTEGQLCTVLKAREHFENDEDLLIIASDSYIKSNIGNHIDERPADIHGIISVIDLPGEQWSFVKTGNNQKVIEVAEKVRISSHASTGIYYFSNGKEFCEEADNIITRDERSKNEFYIIPVYQKLINKKKHIITSEAEEMWDMGTPDSKQSFEDHINKNGI